MPIYFYSKHEEYGFLSNFSPFGFYENGLKWKTVEHYFQARKFTDPGHFERIRLADTPKDAKRLGQSRLFPILEDWEEIRIEVMKDAVAKKFSANPDLIPLLIRTGDEDLVENSPHDHFWGCGSDGTGENRLGRILVELRTRILQGGLPSGGG